MSVILISELAAFFYGKGTLIEKKRWTQEALPLQIKPKLGKKTPHINLLY